MKQALLLISILFTVTMQGQDKIESSIEEYYDGTSWRNSYGSNYEYDSNNNLISETSFLWDDTSGWIEDFKEIYTYNSNNIATELIEQEWDVNQWVNSYKNIYTYNSNGDILGFLSQEWNNSQWVDNSQGVLTYNDGLPLTIVYSDWNGSQWINDGRETRNYSGSNVTEILYEEWDVNQWAVPDDREVYIYNSNNEIITSIDYNWNGSVWVEYDRTDYVLDANGNRISETDIYEGTTEDKIEYNYDLTAQLSSFSHPFKDKTGADYLDEDFPYVNKILSQNDFNYNTTTSTYDISSRVTYDYNSPLVLSNKEFNSIEKISLYPNPANSFISLKGLNSEETISIYNVLSSKISEQNIKVNDKIDVQEFPTGMYFLKFKNGYILKFLKK